MFVPTTPIRRLPGPGTFIQGSSYHNPCVPREAYCILKCEKFLTGTNGCQYCLCDQSVPGKNCSSKQKNKTIPRCYDICFSFFFFKFKIVLSLNNTVCDNYANYTNKHVTKRIFLFLNKYVRSHLSSVLLTFLKRNPVYKRGKTDTHIVKSGIKHHQTNKHTYITTIFWAISLQDSNIKITSIMMRKVCRYHRGNHKP